MSAAIVVPEPMLRKLLAGLVHDAAEVDAATVDSPGQASQNEFMAAGILWAVNAIEIELLGGAGDGGDA